MKLYIMVKWMPERWKIFSVFSIWRIRKDTADGLFLYPMLWKFLAHWETVTSFFANRQGLPGLSLIRAVQEGCKEKRVQVPPWHRKDLKMEKLTLNYKGRDSWSRPVYEAGGNLYVDVDPRKDRKPHICTKYNNEFDGEPDMPVSEDIQFTFVPCRDTWN